MADSHEGLEEQRLRRALKLIGDEAGRDPGRGGARAVRTAGRRPRRPLMVAALVAVAAVGAGVVAVSVLEDAGTAVPGGRETSGAGQGQTLPEAVSCARMIVEGEVTSVEGGEEPNSVTLTLDVQEWIKPESGGPTVRTAVLDPAHVDPEDELTSGTDVLIVVPQLVSRPAEIYEGDRIAEERALIVENLPEAERTECPPEWRGTEGTGG
ncbi:hypothetical protein ACWFMI_21305 [Nocardiopsis terrae]